MRITGGRVDVSVAQAGDAVLLMHKSEREFD